MKKYLFVFTFLSFSVFAQAPLQLETVVQKHVKNYYGNLYDFMSLPSNAHIKEQIQPNLDWLKKAFGQQGFSTEFLPSAVSAPPFTWRLSEAITPSG